MSSFLSSKLQLNLDYYNNEKLGLNLGAISIRSDPYGCHHKNTDVLNLTLSGPTYSILLYFFKSCSLMWDILLNFFHQNLVCFTMLIVQFLDLFCQKLKTLY